MRRVGNALGFLACAGLLAYAYYAQFVLKLEPCPLCIFERIGVAAIGLLFLIAALHNPGRIGARIYGVLLLVASLTTMGVAARHVWIQHLPADQVPVCGASLNYMLQIFPVTAVIRKVLTGSGECAHISWRLLGLSMPGWVFIAAAGLAVLSFWTDLKARR